MKRSVFLIGLILAAVVMSQAQNITDMKKLGVIKHKLETLGTEIRRIEAEMAKDAQDLQYQAKLVTKQAELDSVMMWPADTKLAQDNKSKKLIELRAELKKLEADRPWRMSVLEKKETEMAKLEKEADDIITKYVTQDVPDQPTLRETHRWLMGFKLKEQDRRARYQEDFYQLSLKKFQATDVQADPILGYRGMLINPGRGYFSPSNPHYIMYSILPVDENNQPIGMDPEVTTLNDGTQADVYLLPGRYQITTVNEHDQVLSVKYFRVSPQPHLVKVSYQRYNSTTKKMETVEINERLHFYWLQKS